MSLYGALFAGVGGLKAQGTKIGIISDNISNVNTTGYKATKAAFETLVVNTGSKVSYAPGGVIAKSVQLVDKQGILTATDAPTDIAISGGGFFTVNAQIDGSGQPLYTRAGSFRQDELGNFVNSQGFYLQGWPLDREGRLPGEPGNLNTVSSANLDSLQVVNIETQSGVASATTTVEVGANLDAGEEVHPGSGVTMGMDITNAVNYGITGNDVIVPDTAATGNGIIAGDAFTVQTGGGLTYTYTYGGYTEGNDVTAGIVNATTATQAFLSSAGGYSQAELSFSIETGGITNTFKYVASSPNPANQEFNNLTNLAAAINETGELSARVANGRLYIAPLDANDAMTFANVETGALAPVGGPYAPGGNAPDWIAELGLVDTVASVTPRFASLQSLANLVNQSDGITAVITNPLAEAQLEIRVDDPLDQIAFYDGTDANPLNASTNTGSFILEFGLASHAKYNDDDGDPGTAPAATTANNNYIAPLAASYNASSDGTGLNGYNMASGDIVADFSRNVRVYDALGGGHDLRVSFLKIGENTWAAEVHALPATDVTTNLVNGQVAVGTIAFNGDGSLRSMSGSLTDPITVNWTNGAAASEITFDWGTAGLPFGTPNAAQIGLTDGLSQFESDYNVAFVNQNGAPVGELIGVVIDDLGFVIASYTNGETQKLYQLPIADFTNPNGLRSISGNVYAQTQDSGEVNLRVAGTNGTGTIVSAALESSNVELAEELTDMIVAQRAYQASSKVISTTDELLEELNRL